MNTGNHKAQGTLGGAQLSKLEQLVDKYAEKRRQGTKLIVCIHHSPLTNDQGGCLSNRQKFLGRVCKCSFMDNAPSWR